MVRQNTHTHTRALKHGRVFMYAIVYMFIVHMGCTIS